MDQSMDAKAQLGLRRGAAVCVWVGGLVSRPVLEKSCTSVPAKVGRDACREAEDEMMGWESAISHSSHRIASHRTISQHQRACNCELRLRLRRQHAIPSGWTRFSYEHFFSHAFALYASFNPFPVKGNHQPRDRDRDRLNSTSTSTSPDPTLLLLLLLCRAHHG